MSILRYIFLHNQGYFYEEHLSIIKDPIKVHVCLHIVLECLYHIY